MPPFTVQMWHWLVDEKLIGSKECHDLRPSLTRHLTSTSCTGKQKQACATPSWPSRWRMISAKVVHFKISSHEASRTNTSKHDTCNKNKSQSQHISSHISTHLHKFFLPDSDANHLHCVFTKLRLWSSLKFNCCNKHQTGAIVNNQSRSISCKRCQRAGGFLSWNRWSCWRFPLFGLTAKTPWPISQLLLITGCLSRFYHVSTFEANSALGFSSTASWPMGNRVFLRDLSSADLARIYRPIHL